MILPLGVKYSMRDLLPGVSQLLFMSDVCAIVVTSFQ